MSTTNQSKIVPKKVLVTLGYSGWAAGQLEEEMGRNGWINVGAEPGIIFDTPVEERYDKALSLLGIDARMLSPAGRRGQRQQPDAQRAAAAHDRCDRGRPLPGDRETDCRMATRWASRRRAVPSRRRRAREYRACPPLRAPRSRSTITWRRPTTSGARSCP